MIKIFFLLLGFILLIKGADFFVEGASSLAKKFAISEVVIGLTVVAFGTSSPELIVNVFSSVNGQTGITLGNIVGSNILNILLILGVAGCIKPLTAERNTIWKEIPFAFLAAIIFLVISNDVFLGSGDKNFISRSDGILLLLFFSIFLTYTFGIPKIEIEDTPEVIQLSTLKTTFFILLGLGGLILGGKFVVDNAVLIAQNFQVSDKLIGLTIVSIGTSLPELATSAVAAYKGKSDIAVGNVVGSNIFNVFFVLGVSSCISNIPFQIELNLDLIVLLIASLCLFLTMFIGEKKAIDRFEASAFLVMYFAYTAYLIIRQ